MGVILWEQQPSHLPVGMFLTMPSVLRQDVDAQNQDVA